MLSDRIQGLRREHGWSQEELAERLEVSRQSVSKWESGASQPDVERIVDMSRLFGVSTDFLLTGEGEGGVVRLEKAPEPVLEARPLPPEADGLRVLSAAEADRFLENRRQCAPTVGWGSALCVASPAPMMLLLGMEEVIGETFATAAGVGLLLVAITAAVMLFIQSGQRMSKYGYLDKEPFYLRDELRQAVDLQRQDFKREQSRSVTLGVGLCVLSPVPVTVGGILGSQFMTMQGVAALLIMVALGVFLFVRDGMILDSYSHVLQEGKFEVRRKRKRLKG